MSTTSPTSIPIVAHKAVTGVLFGVAILTTAVRIYIRAFKLKQLALEDGLLLFAVAVLCGVTILCYATVRDIYNFLDLILLGAADKILLDVIEAKPTEAKETSAMAMLWWLVIFPIKFAYLFFFRKLIFRLKKIKIWWWCVTVFMVPAAVACFVITWFACPYTRASDMIEHCSGPSAAARKVRVSLVTTACDVVTDCMIASLPIILLWNVKMRLHQKLGLGIILSLSRLMVIVAIIRITSIHMKSGEVDIIWLAFWQQQECSIAVSTFAITAFRAFFVEGSSTPRRARVVSAYWKKKKLLRKKASDDSEQQDVDDLPSIPAATWTGMRGMIGGSGKPGIYSDLDGGIADVRTSHSDLLIPHYGP